MLKKMLLFQGEPEAETKKPESYVILVEFLLQPCRFSLIIYP